MPRVRPDLTRSVFSTILRIFGKLHGVTIRRELIHSDQINKFEHAGTDRMASYARDHPRRHSYARPPPAWPSMGEGPPVHSVNVSPIASNAARETRSNMRETTPGLAKHGGGSAVHSVNVSPIASNAARETRSDPQRLLDDTPHLRKATRCHHPPRVNTFRSNK